MRTRTQNLKKISTEQQDTYCDVVVVVMYTNISVKWCQFFIGSSNDMRCTLFFETNIKKRYAPGHHLKLLSQHEPNPAVVYTFTAHDSVHDDHGRRSTRGRRIVPLIVQCRASSVFTSSFPLFHGVFFSLSPIAFLTSTLGLSMWALRLRTERRWCLTCPRPDSALQKSM